ncbi:preprotein translocase subunit SecE [Rubripirellula lacrimiformis]|uniref:Protein translocase subunit SecE n=1 Tax=Rubripirellula lacrimiformis TaxID=1930273 RepID=A0A517NI56_9BACT|nr:preprotein translocase subunit SecE [Rubripirellula lacrimiformis]QDT06814.1 preprotein translocase subunit SecE [Rubripirellula lacrimiformis]
MSRDIASANSVPLTSELFKNTVYKPNQGRIVRQLTALAIWVVAALGCWSLYGSLRGGIESGSYLIPGIPSAVLAAGLWFGYRVVNWPRFADFLIAVEAEMNKVTWPSKDELIRASVVVILTIFILAIALFLFDVLWQAIFDFLGVTT